MRQLLLFITLLSLIISCTKNNVYENNHLIPLIKWNASDTLTYSVTIPDTSSLYNIYFNIRHTEDYPYKNIWLWISIKSPDGKISSGRTELNLADDAGRWYGEGVNNIWDAHLLFEGDTHLSMPGEYTFKIEQDMRQDPLPGIMAVGITIKKHPRMVNSIQPQTDTAGTNP